ncbi:MAG: hypothetical protein HY202_08275 [Nitrospirae bacterium]|nr:hypothetical protein [Nitrospirota bacterium]
MPGLSRNILFFFSFLLFVSFPAHAENWASLTENLNRKFIPMPDTLSSRHALSPAMAFWKGDLYVAWTEPDEHGIHQTYIKKLKEGKPWETFGKSQNRDRTVPSAFPSLGSNGKTLFLSWVEKNNANISQLYVKEWTGSEWVFLENSLNMNPDREARTPSLAFQAETPYIAWSESGEKEWSKLYVKHWDGKSWISDGPGFGLEERRTTLKPALIFEGKTGHLVWPEAGDSRVFQILHAKLENGKWSLDSKPLNHDPMMQAFNPSLSLFKGTLYLAFQEKKPEGDFKLQLRHLTPGGWEDDGSKIPDNRLKIFNPVLASVKEFLFIAWEEWDALGNPRIAVASLSSSGNIKVEAPLNESLDHFGLNPVLLSEDHRAFLAWKENNAEGLYQIRIKKYAP